MGAFAGASRADVQVNTVVGGVLVDSQRIGQGSNVQNIYVTPSGAAVTSGGQGVAVGRDANGQVSVYSYDPYTGTWYRSY